MASRVVMPKLSDTMEEGKILRWLIQEGDKVETGQTLAEVETDKATVEMEAYTNGIMRKLVAQPGETVAIGALIAVIGGADEDVSALLSPAPVAAAPAHEPAPAPRPTARAAARPAAPAAPVVRQAAPQLTRPAAVATAPDRALRASPLALRMAAEAGLELSSIQGTGPQGRIIKRDIETAIQKVATPAIVAPAAPVGDVQEIELSSMRRTIAKRLVQSKAPVPHFYLTVDVAMERLWEAYRALRDEKYGVSLNDVIIKALASALKRHPEMNASFAGDHIKQYSRVHVGVAVALEDGLITPVVRDADSKSLLEIAEESKALAERARQRRLQPHEYTGATFSISNLGMMGIEEFSAIINPPEAAILAVGSVREVPVVSGGQIVPGRRMKMTLSVDHRVADGAQAARFLDTLKRTLENPLLVG
jgi:pyruvate dehydrogenase E2 component (dihydrolipoamide acetyltransferase)